MKIVYVEKGSGWSFVRLITSMVLSLAMFSVAVTYNSYQRAYDRGYLEGGADQRIRNSMDNQRCEKW